ncbi:MAG: hypothetical protein PUK40_05245 [Actinomycetaceae bacterium]|nr:hypothetical protein [Arcanobacterium sp.]MDD7505336.1 hypothetical protein [Actinomycetaceae bacterium]MDY6143934.1 hypothetical protein [Arcanobacterium sp.]
MVVQCETDGVRSKVAGGLWSVLALIISALAAVGFATPAYADPQVPEGELPQAVSQWFASSAARDIVSQSKALKGETAQSGTAQASDTQNTEITLGAAQRVYNIVGESDLLESDSSVVQATGASEPGIYVVDRWYSIASSSDGSPVALLFAAFGADLSTPRTSLVVGDPAFAQVLQRSGTSLRLAYDSQLDAWFIAADDEIAPANKAAQAYLLGWMPLEQFLAQRERILGNDAPEVVAPEMIAGAQEQESRMVMASAGIAGALFLLALSVVWLEYERHYLIAKDTENSRGAANKVGRRKGVIEADDSTGSAHLSEPARRVLVYRRSKKDEES